MFREAISEIILDDSFMVDTTELQSCLLLARRLITLLSGSLEHREFAEWLYLNLSPSAWADQRGCQGDKLVINRLITIMSPCPETLKLCIN